MARTVGIGIQDFGKMIRNNNFYIDKTAFLKEWWESGDEVTLITRPRRFGKTLALSMAEHFFSVRYSGCGEKLFAGLSIWKEEKYRMLQGTYPVISLSFSGVKDKTYLQARKKICYLLADLYADYAFIFRSDLLEEQDKAFAGRVSMDMDDTIAAESIRHLCKCLSLYYGKKTVLLLDEYDTPMHEAYVEGYWEEMAGFVRSLFHETFKRNSYLERAVMTGITRISKESIFSDLNHLKVVGTTSDIYEESFGFTEEEVFDSLEEMGLSERRQDVKKWYDGFTFGEKTDIYNPWSIINYLREKKFAPYWANTSSNSLAGKLIREGSREIKQEFETLLCGGTIQVLLDEQIVFNQLLEKKGAVWSFLLASGYLKAAGTQYMERAGRVAYELALTNREVRIAFEDLVLDWFGGCAHYNDFIKALLIGDVKAMNVYMNKVALDTFSYFDTGKHPSEAEPERFYHGFVLGLAAELSSRYALTSNRESGFGRYDVMLEPRDRKDNAILLEFKVQDAQEEANLSDTVQSALDQIEEKNYAAALIQKGIPKERIRRYGFAFCGKQVLIGTQG